MKKKILAIDDEPDVLILLSKRLQVRGYQVLCASGGSVGIEIARREKPDLILLDILMPDMDGSETAAVLRQDPLTREIPILFLTCLFTKREENLEGHEAGKNIFLAKPYDPAELLAEIERLI